MQTRFARWRAGMGGAIAPMLAVAGLGLVACGGKSAPPPPLVVGDRVVPPEEVVAAAKATLEQYQQAWTGRSVDTLIGLYANTPDVVLVRQGEPHMGPAAVEEQVRGVLGKAKEVHIKVAQTAVATLGADSAVVTSVMARSVSDGVTAVDEVGVLSLVVRREGERWVIVSEHFSYAPRR